MTRKECLEQAAKCVLQNRQDQYGDVEDCFKKIARLWNAYLPSTIELEPFDVACMMALLKIARIQANPKHGDSWVDLAGYAACGADIAVPEPFRYDKPKADGDCRQNGNDQPEEPKFKPGDAVEWNSVGSGWLPAVYEREFGDFGHCVVQMDGSERIVSKVDLRRPEANCPENPDSLPEFKRGDKVEVQMAPDSNTWASAVITAVYRDKDSCEWRYCVDFEDGWAHLVVPSARVRPATAPRAEGCEALVEKDAPQTPQELCKRIIDANPATFKARTPTGEELAEMAEEEKRG